MSIEDAVKIVEIGIGITIATIIMSLIINILAGTDFFSYIREMMINLGTLFGGRFANFIFTAFTGILLVMFGRWLISWLGSNGGQNPNSNS